MNTTKNINSQQQSHAFVKTADYRQDAAKRQTAGIRFTHRPKIRFFAPQGRLVAPIRVKLCRTDGHLGPLGCDLQNTTGKGVVGNIRLLKAKTTKAAKKPAPAAKKPKNKDKVEEAIKKHPTPWPPRSWQEPTPPWNQDKKGAKKPAKNATASKAKAAAAAKAKAKKQAAAAKAKAAAAAKVKKPAKKRKNPVK